MSKYNNRLSKCIYIIILKNQIKEIIMVKTFPNEMFKLEREVNAINGQNLFC